MGEEEDEYGNGNGMRQSLARSAFSYVPCSFLPSLSSLDTITFVCPSVRWAATPLSLSLTE